MKELTHAEAFDWLEEHKAQVWYDKGFRKWTCQVMVGEKPNTKVIQPSANSLWVAVQLAAEQLDEWTTSLKTS